MQFSRTIVRLAAICSLFVLSAYTMAGVTIFDTSRIVNVDQREEVRTATQVLKATPTDMAALERLLQFFGTRVIGPIGVNTHYAYEDPVKRDAYAVLQDWYSTAFLGRVLQQGPDLAAYWAIRKIGHQATNSYDGYRKGQPKLAKAPRLRARGGLITPGAKRAFLPALLLRMEPSSPLSRESAEKLIKDFGLLADRASFLEALDHADEKLVAEAISSMLRTTRVDPLLTPEIWDLLGTAQSDWLRATCLSYPWLFDVPVFDKRKEQITLTLFTDPSGSVQTNLNSALSHLALSKNPLVTDILSSLAATSQIGVKEKALKYKRIYEECLADDKLQGVPPAQAMVEPLYADRRLSSWLQDLVSDQALAPDKRRAAEEALRGMGSAILPALVNRLRVTDPPLDRMEDRRTLQGFAVLGPDASPAIPDLIELLAPAYDAAHSPRTGSVTTRLKDRKSTYCISALRVIGERSVLLLIEALVSTDKEVRFGAAMALERFPGQAEVIVPALIETLQDQDPGVRWRAARTVGALASMPELSIPALVKRLREDGAPNVRWYACMALAEFGPLARIAIPDLAKATSDPDSGVRSRAQETLSEVKRLSKE